MDKILGWIRENAGPFPCGRWLAYGWFAEFVVLLAADARVSTIIISVKWRCYVYAAVFAIWGCIWLILRFALPRTGHRMIGLVLCIDTDGTLAEKQVHDDLVRRLGEAIAEFKLANKMQILNCNPAQSRVANTILSSLKAKDMAAGDSPRERRRARGPGWQWLTRGTRGQLYVWGIVRKRADEDGDKYWLQLDALATHASLDEARRQAMQKEFGSVWQSKFRFDSHLELPAIESMGNWLALTSLYLVGLAVLVSADPDTAFLLHSTVVARFPESGLQMPPPMQVLREHARSIAVEEACMLASRSMGYEDADQALDYIAKAFALKPNHLPALLLRARVEWALLSDTNAAMRSVQQAKLLSGNVDGTWRYDYAFLLMQQQRYPEALGEYKKIATTRWFPGEDQVVASVVDFFEEYIVKQPTVATHEFALAFILYKRQYNLPNALSHFDAFLEKSAIDKALLALRERALSYNIVILQQLKLHNRRDQQTP